MVAEEAKAPGSELDGIIAAMADIGRAIEERLKDGAIALLVVLLAWVLVGTPFAEILLTFLVVNAYYKGRKPPESKSEGEAEAGRIAARVPELDVQSVLTLLGLVLVVAGIYWLVVQIVETAVPWPVHLIVVGLILVVIGVWGRKA